MPENNLPAQNPQSEALPGEFDFTQPPTVNPRVKRRSLKAKPATPLKPVGEEAPTAARELEQEAPSRPMADSNPTPPPDADQENDIDTTVPVKPHERQRPAYASTTRPASTRSTPAASQPASPHGTRPATLYYSQRKTKEESPSMKPTSSPASSTPASSAAPVRTTTSASTTSSVRPASVVDYRANVERQSREQKSVGNILSIIVYVLIGLFVVGATLAGYGAYVVHKALHDQSVTVSDLDARYAAANKDINTRLSTTLDTLTQAQAQIVRQQDLILKQQDSINKLLNSVQDTAAALRQEKAARADETASLRARVKTLEYRGGQVTHQY